MTLGQEQQHGQEHLSSQMASKRRRQQHPQVIDLASQGSVDLCGSSPAAAAAAGIMGSRDSFGVADRSQQALMMMDTAPMMDHAGAAAAAAAAAGQKRLWGEMASTADDVTLVGTRGPTSMYWGSTRPRGRRTTRTPAAEAAAPILILDDDSPATLSNSMKQQLHLQSPQCHARYNSSSTSGRRFITPMRANPASTSPSLRPMSISANPSIANNSMQRAGGNNAGAAAAAAAGNGSAQQAAPPVRRRGPPARRLQPVPHAVPAAAPMDGDIGGGGGGGERRNSNSSSSSAELVDLGADAALARKLLQEEEDALLAQRLMQEEQAAAEQARLKRRQELESLQAAMGPAAGAAAGAGGARGHISYQGLRQVPAMPFMPGMPPGYEAADNARYQRMNAQGAGPLAAGAGAQQQPQQPHQQPQQRQVRSYADFGQAMAHMLLSMPAPRFPGRPSGGSAARRGFPAHLVQMREAVLGMQRAGLPPHLLFSDRDFTADDYELLCRLDETVENRKGAAATTIAALPTQTVPAGGLAGAAGERLSCAVCLEEFAEGAELRSLPCLHRFHKGCIDTWLHQKASCPVCNRDCT